MEWIKVLHTHISQAPQAHIHLQHYLRKCVCHYRWWKEAQDSAPSDGKSATLYAVAPAPSYGAMKLINNIFSPDIAFNLRREEETLSQSQENGEVGVSGRDYALVPGDMWLQALKWLVFRILFSLYSLKCVWWTIFLLRFTLKFVEHSENHLQLVCWFLLLLRPLTSHFFISHQRGLKPFETSLWFLVGWQFRFVNIYFVKCLVSVYGSSMYKAFYNFFLKHHHLFF